MLTKSSLLLLGSWLALTAGCAPKTQITAKPGTPPSAIEKDTQTHPQISTVDDQIALAFNEIGWSRQSATLSINPPSLSSKEGCVTRRPLTGARFLFETYDCKRVSDASDTTPNLRYEASGSQSYVVHAGNFQVDGGFTTRIYTQADHPKLLSQGTLNRQTRIAAPTGDPGPTTINDADLASSTYKMTSTASFIGEVPQGSGRQQEAWKSNLTGGLSAAVSQPLKLLTGASIKLSYLPEADKTAKRASQIVTLTATSDINFVSDGTCLRPVGQFVWTMGQDIQAAGTTITTSVAGYTRADDGSTHAWGKRCLER